MKLLFIGDTVGKPGRKAVTIFLPKILKEYSPDVVIQNAENISGGLGTNLKSLEEMEKIGVDYFTGGNDSFREPKVFSGGKENLLRPENLESGAESSGHKIISIKGKKLLLINLLGRVFMKIPVRCPFRIMEEILEKYKDEDLEGIFVDFHAEATSEKSSFFYRFQHDISAMIGTHTHVPTANAHIWGSGAFYLTDVGMTGVHKSVIGFDPEKCIGNFYSPYGKKKLEVAKGPTVFRAVLLDIFQKKTQNFITFEYFEDDIL